MLVKAITSGRSAAFLGLALLAVAGGASAQMYKWVDANGKTHFTDQPPPATAKSAPIKTSSTGQSNVELPYALTVATRSSPVTLYTTSSCPGCDEGRTHLKNRGIPFVEKTVTNSNDEEHLKQAGTGDGKLPLLLVGRTKLTGFNAKNWDSTLTLAQYPAKKMLPANYRYPAPQAAAPVKAAAPVAQQDKAPVEQTDEEEGDKTPRVPAPRNAPPGFKF